MKNIMKRNTISLILITCLLAFGATQVWAVTYKGSYQPSAMSRQYSAGSYQGVVAPAVGFQSTSAYAAPEWAEQPMLNSDGTVNEGAYMGGRNNAPGPRRTEGREGGEGGTGTPGGEGEDHIKQPLGDALIPLALLACAYAIYKVSRRRKGA